MSAYFGYRYSEDGRDQNYPVSEIVDKMPHIPKKEWYSDAWYGNQGSTSQCVAYSWTHWFEDGPIIHDKPHPKPAIDTDRFYHECQLRDEWPGTDYNGTSVRAAAKVLKKLGIISEYRWANNIDEVIKSVSLLGPMVIGTMWYEEMNRPSSQGYISVRGRQQGGHAYIINGVDSDQELFRIKNSWGRQWGKNGHAYIRFRDMEKMMKDWSQACIAFGNRFEGDKVNFDELTR